MADGLFLQPVHHTTSPGSTEDLVLLWRRLWQVPVLAHAFLLPEKACAVPRRVKAMTAATFPGPPSALPHPGAGLEGL